jgi:hypothetical protein
MRLLGTPVDCVLMASGTIGTRELPACLSVELAPAGPMCCIPASAHLVGQFLFIES